MFDINKMRNNIMKRKILVRGREGKTKVFLYSEFNKPLLRIACSDLLIHNSCNLVSDGYYIAKVKNIFLDKNQQKRIEVTDMRFLTDYCTGLADIEPYLYYSQQIENVLGAKVAISSEILRLILLLEGSINRPITVATEVYPLFTRVIDNYKKSNWNSMWENIFLLQVTQHRNTRYPWIKELQVELMDTFNDLEFDYEKFVADITGDYLPTEQSLKDLEAEISYLLTDNGEDDSVLESLGDYFVC